MSHEHVRFSYEVALIVGSLRPGGLSARLAAALTLAAPPRLALRRTPIAALPLYGEDLETDVPPPVTGFRRCLAEADAVLLVTPEYNRSIPGGLKNALDIASRPYGQSVLTGKPAAIASQSPGALGGFGANHALRQTLVFLDMPAMPQPELYLGHADKVLGAGGEISDPGVSALLRRFMTAFEAWIGRNAGMSA
jgi:chromate reductase